MNSVHRFVVDGRSLSKGGLMNSGPSLNALPYGLLELDANGTVLYFKPDREKEVYYSAADLVGRNLFTDVAPLTEAKDFQDRIKSFRRSPSPADSFNFTFS